ncbi:MAG: sugar transferase [Desulfobacterales bacterium]|nr:sugar transferase [Desulfobacterales bacterium]
MESLSYNPFIKHTLDKILAFTALIFLSPFLLIIALLIRIDSVGPVLFAQRRVGEKLRSFMLYKFRTMTCQTQHGSTQFNPGDTCRVTRIGAMLRSTKLDELPELFNILKGEMSIIGPRPEVPSFVAIYPDDFGKVLQARPGLSDFASIKYRNEEVILAAQNEPEVYYQDVILPDKLRLAKQYVENISFKTDAKIMAATITGILGEK